MELRTAYCLNALFQRRNISRLLNTFCSRIEINSPAGSESRTVIHTPFETARLLSAYLEPGHAVFRHDAIRYDAQHGAAPIEFVVEGLIHDPRSRSDHMVEALSMKFFDLNQPSELIINEQFLKGLVHCDAMPDRRGPDLGTFTATLRQGGEFWQALDFLHTLAPPACGLKSINHSDHSDCVIKVAQRKPNHFISLRVPFLIIAVIAVFAVVKHFNFTQPPPRPKTIP